MSTPFGPQLIGETEKTLNALLRRILGDRLTEPEWVTLRLALQLDGEVGSGDELAAHVADRAQFEDAASIVAGLTGAGLLADGRPTDAGRSLVAELQVQVAEIAGPMFRDLPPADVDAAGRVLNTLVTRARAELG